MPGMGRMPAAKCRDLKNSCTMWLDSSGEHFQICASGESGCQCRVGEEWCCVQRRVMLRLRQLQCRAQHDVQRRAGTFANS